MAGGETGTMATGGVRLKTASRAVTQAAATFSGAASHAGGAAGDPAIAAALSRFGAAWSQVAEAIGIQMLAAAQLAGSTADDLDAAGGYR